MIKCDWITCWHNMQKTCICEQPIELVHVDSYDDDNRPEQGLNCMNYKHYDRWFDRNREVME